MFAGDFRGRARERRPREFRDMFQQRRLKSLAERPRSHCGGVRERGKRGRMTTPTHAQSENKIMNASILLQRRLAVSTISREPAVKRAKGLVPHVSTAILLLLAVAVFQRSAFAQNRCISITCPTNMVVECAGPRGTAVSFNPTAQTICGRTVTITCTPPSGAAFFLGTNAVTCVARDDTGATSQCSFLVTIRDTQGPRISAPSEVAVPCTSASGAVATFNVTASDVCDGLTTTVACTPPSGSLFPPGTTTVNCTAIDANGNTTRASFPVTVSRDCSPECLVLTCPNDIQVECGPAAGTVVRFDVVATNVCGGSASVQCTPSSGSVFPMGVTTVTCAAQDGKGNTKRCAFRVTVSDSIAPRLQVPSEVRTNCSSAAGTIVNFTVTASDVCDLRPTFVCTPPSGSFFPAGTTTVSCSATDTSGNVARSSFPVIVSEECCLALECPRAITAEATSTNGTAVMFSVTATNRCGGVANVICQPPSSSVFVLGTTTVNCTAVDGKGYTRACSFTVTVKDTTAPQIQVPTGVATPCTSPLGAVVIFTASALDATDPKLTLMCVPPSGSTFPIGATTVICTAKDAASNTVTKSFSVSVTGDCATNCVQISCPTNITINLGSARGIVTGPFGGPPAIAVTYDVEALNTCTGSNLLVDCAPPSGSYFKLGAAVVSCYTVDGPARAVCSFQVLVKDSTPPTITVPRAVFAPCNLKRGDGIDGANVTFSVKATDNAGAPALVCTPPPGSFVPVGRSVVECVATDPAGNKATNRFTVNVTTSLYCSLASTLEDFPDNWGFELGLTAWEATGDAFADQPVEGDRLPVKRVKDLANQIQNDLGGDYWKDIGYPVGHKGEHWIGTAEDINALPGGLFEGASTEERAGMIRSKSFIIEKPYISFLIGGTDDGQKLRVELLLQTQVAGADTVTHDGLMYKVSGVSATGHNREVMRWMQWGVGNHIGERAIIRIIDNSTIGHLNVDDFRFEDTHFLAQKVKIGGKEYPAWIQFEGYYYRWDSPVWGFADMHTHPMGFLGFGEAVLRGKVDGDISTSLENCRCFHAIPPPEDLGCGDFMRGLVMKVMENGPDAHGPGYSSNGYAQFSYWPQFSSIAHQQMWYEWIQRASQGGLRVMVALCVNNPMLAVGAKGLKGKNHDKYV